MNKRQVLKQDFYTAPVWEVAPALLGQILVLGDVQGIITETEAYGGKDDPASHAFKGKTPRAEIMFGRAGMAYVYFIYGMYHCLNIVTGQTGQASAVLIRGLLLPGLHLDGPGKICRHLGITKAHNGLDVTNASGLHLTEGILVQDYLSTKRIGITKAQDKLWRFKITSISSLSYAQFQQD